MHCSDLERYLEACLDGQLGDSRRRALQEHLRLCRGCAERVDGLRRFEADLQRRLRAMQHEASLWQPLGLETVHGGSEATALPIPAAPRDEALPAPPPRRHRLRVITLQPTPEPKSGPKSRGRLQSLAGVALLAAALGALADMALGGLGWLQGDKRTAVYRAYLDGAAELDLVTEEPAQLEAWLADKLGAPVEVPSPPTAFTLVGGNAGDAGLAADTGLVVYNSDAGPALLLIENALERPVAVEEPNPSVDDGLTRRDWQSGPYTYSLISPLPPNKLAAFTVD